MNKFFERASGPCAGALIALSVPHKNPPMEIDWLGFSLGLVMLASHCFTLIDWEE